MMGVVQRTPESAPNRVQPGLLARKSTWRYITRTVVYIVLSGCALLLIIPLMWTTSSSLKTSLAVFEYPPKWIPHPIVWENYPEVFGRIPYARFYLNTIFITVVSVIGAVTSASLVAYGFARMRFVGRGYLFVFLLSTMMIPFPVYMIPQFVLFRHLGWLDSWLPLIVPSYFGSAFHIFLLRQFFMTVPLEMDDAAKIDGCSSLGVYLRILVPMSLPAHGIVGIFSFLSHWNEFLPPLLYLNTLEKYTLSIGLQWFKGGGDIVSATEWNLLMAASVMMMIPPLVLFFSAQRYFIQGIVFSGLKQ